MEHDEQHGAAPIHLARKLATVMAYYKIGS
jgi:hypothetical protein